MSGLGQPVRIKYILSLAFIAARTRPPTDRPLKPPGKNWAKAFEKRHPQTAARRIMAIDWNRHDKNTAAKMTHWLEAIGQILRNPAILADNVYNMDETGVMLSMLGSVKALIGKDGKRNYGGGRVKRTTVTAIECISADGRYLNPMIIWPATTHRSNWTVLPTPGWQYACNESRYADSNISLQWLKCVFDPEAKECANGRPRVLILDGFTWIPDYVISVAKHWCDILLIQWCDGTPVNYTDRAWGIDRISSHLLSLQGFILPRTNRTNRTRRC
ncbi:DDE-domain-containing protein [Pyrenophora tritici-repentis]|nr:DDE-domain-containing protein [Pyrenophora tritici-repentis]KAI0570757.1 DDE-domain-containing protein [Pyrenophora tritici-repentis]KAI0571711.1 DDE-domain-containing protein [Pyrenophora tritici-repentis]KAI0605163.1 DDE-domain-containing protein [Pyrenophora tritici-repentis]KAI0617480.1 DDE-domain-containing protein [Pyrenophora tritici-repentis]